MGKVEGEKKTLRQAKVDAFLKTLIMIKSYKNGYGPCCRDVWNCASKPCTKKKVWDHLQI